MRAVRKKRGWVYRVSLAGVTALAVGVGVLWVSSYFIVYEARLALSSSTGWAFFVNLGSFEFIHIDSLLDVGSMFRLYFHEGRLVTGHLWGFYWKDRPWGWAAVIPLWVPFLVLSIWPTLAAVRWVRSRPRPGCCAACGYDLRGSVGSVSCPECGERIVGVGKVKRG